VAAVTKLRREFRKAGVEYKVVKNSLIRHALKDSQYKALRRHARARHARAPRVPRGMTGVAWCKEDPSAAAKVIETFKKTNADPQGEAQGEGRPPRATRSASAVGRGRDVQAPGPQGDPGHAILATIKAPAQQTSSVLNAPAQNLVYVLAGVAGEARATGRRRSQ
jgi:large subunit ribosomal protein L10